MLNRSILLIIFATVCISAVIYYITTFYLNSSNPIIPGKLKVIETTLPIPASRYNTNYQAPKNKYTVHSFYHDSKQRKYHVLKGVNDNTRPILVLLHGSQRNGAAMLDMWEGVARMNDIHLLAPDSADIHGWSLRNDPLSFLSSMISDARTKYGFTSNNVFLFGHSSGAVHAVYLSLLEENPFKAVAAHAGFPSKENLSIVLKSASVSKIPIVFYLGTDDHIFSVENAKNSIQLLVEDGQDVDLIILENHTHWYYTAASYINQMTWDFKRLHDD